MRAALLFLASLPLAGCQTMEQRPPLLSEVRTVEIKVPVPVPCIDPKDVDPLPQSAMPPKQTSTVDQLANGAFVDSTRLLELAKRQREMLLACAKAGSTQPAK